MEQNKTRTKFEIVKQYQNEHLDFKITLEKLKTAALMYGDYTLAAEIRLEQLKIKK